MREGWDGESAFVSVDVEAAGPHPSGYSLLSIGACLIFEPDEGFYVEFQPIHDAADPQAMAVNRLSLSRLRREGVPPHQAMEDLQGWLSKAAPGQQPVFVAFNAPFDWMFVNDYFHRFLSQNPFGHTALDMKALFMGLASADWQATSMSDVARHYGVALRLSHHALRDAQDQASLFRRMMEDLASR
jgi:DNA polymerase III epsilon subunit-like protein